MIVLFAGHQKKLRRPLVLHCSPSLQRKSLYSLTSDLTQSNPSSGRHPRKVCMNNLITNFTQSSPSSASYPWKVCMATQSSLQQGVHERYTMYTYISGEFHCIHIYFRGEHMWSAVLHSKKHFIWKERSNISVGWMSNGR